MKYFYILLNAIYYQYSNFSRNYLVLYHHYAIFSISCSICFFPIVRLSLILAAVYFFHLESEAQTFGCFSYANNQVQHLRSEYLVLFLSVCSVISKLSAFAGNKTATDIISHLPSTKIDYLQRVGMGHLC